MSTAFDYSAGRIAPAVLKAAGATAVFRYVSTPGNPKNITKAEYAELTAAGIEVGLVFETTATWMLGGYGAGVAAARSARSQATAVGYPVTHPLWFAADFDTAAHLGSVATVVDCLHGCADAEGSKALVRAYGDYAVIEAAYTAGFTGGWQTVAWSGGVWSAHALIRQTGKTATEAGIEVDIDIDLGPLFPQPTPAPKPTPVPEEDTDMMCIKVPNSATVTAADVKDHQVWLLSGSLYVHLDSPSYASLMAQGVRTAEWTWAQHQAALAAAGQKAAA